MKLHQLNTMFFFAGNVDTNLNMLRLGSDDTAVTSLASDLFNSIRLEKSQLLSIEYELQYFTTVLGETNEIIINGLSFVLPTMSGVLDVSSSNIILNISDLISVSTNITGILLLSSGETKVTLKLKKL